ncbi:MAG TPA: maltose alpha-D-glucosyltransferase [Candidatus Limnocylindrales bacterium]|nr:maltose alpha-D-glucosyltransferase [Candidatus Limnocylindrales bacterium]
MIDDPLWYKDAVIYELHVRSFFDSDGDGIGDFRGLTEKLDYLRDLGVTAIWILPFYPSPLKDDGYDIADYRSVNPDYGTLRDVRVLIREAHARGLRIITELVCNHTSDQHPWFQRARHAAPGSPARDLYVWSDTSDRYPEARIIFKDFETSNWTWDPVAGAYFWHRFYSHQPDLNFDNPRVQDEILRILDFWLAMGVDGLRLDAIPYLYERDGTNGENLPETHAFLRRMRAHIDERFPGRMLLAEANQWPEDAVAYLGDECNMAFHFPLMPRMFMAIRMEDRYPIIDILAQTPPIPEVSQWALFLRNHDELTLEMVTDEERDYMYRVYATDPEARINLGIRRRLAPLLGDHRRRIELMFGLLFSLPGTPVLYYGDEIGMGDNVYLGDRNGVRTPMQWSADRNAGFSTANRQRLYLPVVIDPEYHYEAVNVANQQANPHSLLWWIKRLIGLRKHHRAFGRGSLEFLQPENRKILAFLRTYGDERILIVANLSRFVQHAELDLSSFEGQRPVELFGQVEFPPIGELPYFLTLGPHEFWWFALEPASQPAEIRAGAEPARLPSIEAFRGWGDLLGRPAGDALAGILPGYLRPRRWFRAKARGLKSATLTDVVPVRTSDGTAAIAFAAVELAEGDPQHYALPLALAGGETSERVVEEAAHAAVGHVGERLLYDATIEPAFAAALLEAIGMGRRMSGQQGEIVGLRERAFKALRGDPSLTLSALPSRAEQSNTSLVFDERFVLKLFRRVEPGINPDLEMGRFLTRHGFTHTPALAGSLEYHPRHGHSATVAMLQAYVPNEGDAWDFTQDDLGHFYERAAAIDEPPPVPDASAAGLMAEAGAEVGLARAELIGRYLDTAWLLGTRTGELHQVLASDPSDPAFAPEAFSSLHQRSMYQSIRNETNGALGLLRRDVGRLGGHDRSLADDVLGAAPLLGERIEALLHHRVDGMRIRCHGDFHLGQVLYTGRDLAVIDFEGEPARPLGERRLRRPALTDVASMLRSFHYAAVGTLRQSLASGTVRAEDLASLEGWARLWYVTVAGRFLSGYREATAGARFVPADEDTFAYLLDVLLLRKAVYELGYELDNRPDWVGVPLDGIRQLLGS